MIPLCKTAAALSVVLCGALTMIARAQEPDEDQPRPRPRPRPEASARPEPDERAAESTPPTRDVPRGTKRPFAGPPGLSEEAIRSYTEMPPSVAEEVSPLAEEQLPPMPSRSSPAKVQQRPEYVVEPPDLLLVEVLEALPGRPISGERLVRPDGRISLGFYGEIPVAGLTLPQIKERIVLHLRKFIGDSILGLVALDAETGEIKRDSDGRIVIMDPKETDRVFVDVTAYNSQHCYVLGEVNVPGSLPYTGGDTVLDLVQYAGGLMPDADKVRIRLVRSFPKGSPARVLPINYEEITMGTDSSTNYAILPNDRLVIPSRGSSRPEGDADVGAASGAPDDPATRAALAAGPRTGSRAQGSGYFNRRASLPPDNPNAALEQRIEALEKKLDRLIEAIEVDQMNRVVGEIEQRQQKRQAEAQQSPVPPGRNPFEIEPPDDADPVQAAPRGMTSDVPRRPGPRTPRRGASGPSGLDRPPHRPRDDRRRRPPRSVRRACPPSPRTEARSMTCRSRRSDDGPAARCHSRHRPGEALE